MSLDHQMKSRTLKAVTHSSLRFVKVCLPMKQVCPPKDIAQVSAGPCCHGIVGAVFCFVK